MLCSLSVTQLVSGLVVGAGVWPSLTECWPLGRLACQVQAGLRGGLRQQLAVALVLVAGERYIAAKVRQMVRYRL